MAMAGWSRVLTTLLLLRAGYAYMPYTLLESVIEHSKESCYRALRGTQGTIRAENPDWQPWLAFFIRALQHQMKRLAGRVKREHLAAATLPAPLDTDHGPCPRARPGDDGRDDPRHRREPQHAEESLPRSGQEDISCGMAPARAHITPW